MSLTKIQLSEDESLLVSNADWILTKNGIIRKVCELFGLLADDFRKLWEENKSLAELHHTRPKISKGENFQGLPYVVLDYPKEFGKENILAIRSMFWWGNYFSISLHLRGSFKDRFAAAILEKRELFARHNFLICISGDEWSHELAPEQFQPVKGMGAALWSDLVKDKAFLKISAKIEFAEWNRAQEAFRRHFQIILEALTFNSPGDETGL